VNIYTTNKDINLGKKFIGTMSQFGKESNNLVEIIITNENSFIFITYVKCLCVLVRA